jgi:glycosyltransferase involved in cell wall biosynthesis
MLTTTASLEDVGFRARLIKLMGKTTSYWMEQNLLNYSDAVIAVSYGVTEELQKYYGFSTTRVNPILNSVDTTFFKPAAGKEGPLTFLYVGRLDYGKGLFDLIQSARQVVQTFPEIKYVLIGGGPLHDQIKQLAEKFGLINNVEFHGVIHDRHEIRQYYQKSYAVLLPSHYEGLPMVMLEAMACGKPLITTTASFTKGVLENGVNALLVPPKSPNELAEASIKLLSDKDLARKLGKQARNAVTEKMDPDKNTEKVLEVYNYAIEKFARRKSGRGTSG